MIGLDGPRMPPAQGGRPARLVIFAHGYGSNGEDLIGLAPYWAPLLPDAAFVSPNAPQPAPGAPGGYQWFPIAARIDPAAMAKGVAQAAGVLERFIAAELKRYALPPSACALVGFSQGTMMALHVGLGLAEPLAAIVGLSGMYTSAEAPRSRPPVLLVHGDRDEMIPPAALFDSASRLAAAGVPSMWRMCPGAGHTVTEDGLALGGAFLKDAFAGRFAGWTSPTAR